MYFQISPSLGITMLDLPGGKFSSGTPTNPFKSIPDLATARRGFTPQNGMWWNSAESGRGFTIEVQGDQLALAVYAFETSGAAVWYIGILTKQINGEYTGTLNRFVGGQTLSGGYKPSTGNVVAAHVSLIFDSETSGNLTVKPVQSDVVSVTAIKRFAFVPNASSAPKSGIETGFWWNPIQAGRGFFIEFQGSEVSIGSYMYDNQGQPVWYITLAHLSANGLSASGPVRLFGGGQSLSGPYKPPVIVNKDLGQLTFTATSATTGTLALPNMVPIPLTRYRFNSAAAVPTSNSASKASKFKNIN